MGREENEMTVYILSAFFRQVCLRLAVTLHLKSLLLSRSLLFSGWSLSHSTSLWVSSDCSVPHLSVLGVVNTTLLLAPGY